MSPRRAGGYVLAEALVSAALAAMASTLAIVLLIWAAAAVDRYLVGSTDLAYDAVQDAFVQALLKLETFERSSTFYTWLYRIAFNQAMSQLTMSATLYRRRGRTNPGKKLQDTLHGRQRLR